MREARGIRIVGRAGSGANWGFRCCARQMRCAEVRPSRQAGGPIRVFVSCGASRSGPLGHSSIAAEQSTESFVGDQLATDRRIVAGRRDPLVAKSLVLAFAMVVLDELKQHSIEVPGVCCRPPTGRECREEQVGRGVAGASHSIFGPIGAKRKLRCDRGVEFQTPRGAGIRAECGPPGSRSRRCPLAR